jgi:hypothetical protein
MSYSNSFSSSSLSPADEDLRRKSSGLNITPLMITKVYEMLLKVGEFEFNLFDVNELLGKKTLYYMSYEIFSRLNFFESFIKEAIFKGFIRGITDGYSRDVAYHNDLHAADTFQTLFVILTKGEVADKLNLSDLDIYAVLLAAICHDFKHPGQNNIYQINAKTELALTYNGNIYNS